MVQVKPLQQVNEEEELDTASNNVMTASFRSCSLPRQKTGQMGGNVAVVSPMPSQKNKRAESEEAKRASEEAMAAAGASNSKDGDEGEEEEKEEGAGALKGLVPMRPLFGAGQGSKVQHALPAYGAGNKAGGHYGLAGAITVNTALTGKTFLFSKS